MARVRVLSSFVVTLAVLALVVAYSLWDDKAQAQAPTTTTTQVAYLPVASLSSKEVAAVHVVNLGRDGSAPPERFTIMFVDTQGMTLVADQVCDVAPGETCSVTLPSLNCPIVARGTACRFRAIVVGEEIPCVIGVPAAPGAGEWQTNLEVFSGAAASKFVAGTHQVLTLPTTSSCSGGVDAASVDAPVDAAPAVDAVIDAPSVDVPPSPDAISAPVARRQ